MQIKSLLILENSTNNNLLAHVAPVLQVRSHNDSQILSPMTHNYTPNPPRKFYDGLCIISTQVNYQRLARLKVGLKYCH